VSIKRATASDPLVLAGTCSFRGHLAAGHLAAGHLAAKEVGLVKLFKTDDGGSLLLRTDFSDDAAWAALCEAVQLPSEEGFVANVQCVSDSDYSGLTVERLLALKPKESGHSFMFIADVDCFTSAEHPILVVDLSQEPGRTFRVIPSEMWGVENNLSLANMEFHEFADNAGTDGVFRGFPSR
jgi:hypothetical protein